MRAPVLCAAALAVVAACQRTETPDQMQARIDRESAAARQVIEAKAAAFARYLNAGQADSLVFLYAPNGRQMPPNMAAAVGRDSIAAGTRAMMGAGTYNLQLHTEAVVANGPLAIERGTYTISFTPGRNAPRGTRAMSDRGKYLVHWHLVNGDWLMVDDMWNSDNPLPGGGGGS